MKRLLFLTFLASVSFQLNAGYFTTSYIAQGVVPAALVGFGCVGDKDGWEVAAIGAAGLALVGARYGAQAYKCTWPYSQLVSKGAQAALPLAVAYLMHREANRLDSNRSSELGDKGGDVKRAVRDFLIRAAAFDAIIQMCF